MSQVELFNEIFSTYRKHGWELRRVLARPETIAELGEQMRAIGETPAIEGAPFDAMWFARPSHQGREAWELRLVAETSYALFETFEPDEAEEEREELRREMEARLRDQVARE
ncbi:MAG: hypothetical protein QOD75_3765 [Blastocatellia bacterium]|jgi:hypothetical protein|nr:hypothetical protein [Blastocatellia bacterium]